jgi:hypothetical protein
VASALWAGILSAHRLAFICFTDIPLFHDILTAFDDSDERLHIYCPGVPTKNEIAYSIYFRISVFVSEVEAGGPQFEVHIWIIDLLADK